MTYLITFVLFQLILSKFLDCWSTQKHIKFIAMEANPIARILMKNLGIRWSIWFIFALALLIMGISFNLAYTGSVVYQWIFVISGSCISGIQYYVAWRNGRVGS